jgi:hypothetical protein
MDVVLWTLVAAFISWEGVAHFVLHNRQGHTLSNRIWLFEKATGPVGYSLVSLSLVALFLHLVLHVF